MKKLYFFFLAIGCWLLAIGHCNAQYVTIPDTAFASWLNANTELSGCMNGNQLDTLCPAVLSKKTIDVSPGNGGGNISNLTGIQYFKTLDTLICGSNPLTNLSQFPSTLTYLDCGSIGYQSLLITLPTLPPTLTYLYCSNIPVFGGLPTLPPTLTYLFCESDGLTSLPNLPSSLSFLACDNNELTNLPALPSSLSSLSCSANQLTSLPALPSSLSELDCDNNKLTSLPTLPSSLSELFCYYNQLTNLPILPSALQSLDCDNNKLTSLPALPSSLTYLDCSYNELTSLLTLPSSLTFLNCSYNELTSLPTLPSSLTTLICYGNKFTSLPTLPPLYTLYCSYNKLTSLPVIPTSLTYLDCSNNKLSSLPVLPQTMVELLVDSNKLLSCLPAFSEFTGRFLSYFDIAGTSITCLPNRISHPYLSSIPAIDTMPLCNIFNNPYGCIQAWNITGNTFFDTANNCDTSVIEPGLGKIKLLLYDSTGINLLQQVITNGDGSYSFNSGLGNYIVKADTAGTPFYVLCPDTNALHCPITAGDSLLYGVNLRLACKNGYDVGVNSINYTSGMFFPGRTANVTIQAGDMATYYGVTCNTSGLAGTVVAVISGPVTISSASGNGIISGNTVTWNIADFSQTNFATAFSVALATNKSAQEGEEVCIDVTVTANSGVDNNPSNNNLSQCFAVVVSHDPNFKEVYPSNITNPGEWLTYTIHFQNTGSAAAENIYVLDTIDNNLDISSIQVIAQSNNAIIQVLPGRIVRFSFPNIFLPDSTANADSSVGYVQYKIKTISTIAPNTIINNTASVYFDYNAPVQTNNAVSVFDVTTGVNGFKVSGFKLQVYPNPTGGIVNISLQGDQSDYQVSIFNTLGQKLFNAIRTTQDVRLTDGQARRPLDLSGLAAGVYFIRVSTSDNTQTVKVVKE